MKVFLTSAFPEREATYIPHLEHLASKDRFRIHTLTDDPETADLILFLDANMHPGDIGLNAIRRHPVAMRHRDKTYLYNEQDQPWCAMPGLYVSMPRKAFNATRQRSCAYVSLPNPQVLEVWRETVAPDLLFSFLGRRGPALRQAILALSHPRALVEDTSGVNFFYFPNEETERRKQRYAEVAARSKFVLCPRGDGVSSFRLFETMAAARVPVIISDQWVPPAGPDWNRCSITIGERDVTRIPAILEEREPEFETMAAAARREWLEWFAPEVLFHRMTEQCLDIHRSRLGRPGWNMLDGRYLWLRAREAKWQAKRWIARAVRRVAMADGKAVAA
ncbi:MAG TPA: exostosin family protein [Chthoniobacteraceae bacterium]|jgi:hypothetical protein|nr:exostosin family protein [Chthoniobacteraceae bacterium]